MRGPAKTPDGAGSDRAGGDRAARLAEALRENLRRRKTQDRARKAATETGAARAGLNGPDGLAAEGRDGGRDAQNVPPGDD